MKKRNYVYIATSIDGYIADRNGSVDWLNNIPQPENSDMGWAEFNNNIDALVMGRVSFETVLGFDVDWPYTKPVFVLSNTMTEIPESHKGKAFLIKGTAVEILNNIHKQGYNKLYIDGGQTIQSFLKEDLIDDLIISTVPILLGGGSPLFTAFPKELEFELVKSESFSNGLVQSHFRRKRSH